MVDYQTYLLYNINASFLRKYQIGDNNCPPVQFPLLINLKNLDTSINSSDTNGEIAESLIEPSLEVYSMGGILPYDTFLTQNASKIQELVKQGVPVGKIACFMQYQSLIKYCYYWETDHPVDTVSQK